MIWVVWAEGGLDLITSKVKILICVELILKALDSAKNNLLNYKKCKFEDIDVMTFTIKNSSQNFGYSSGVLHHISNTFLDIKIV